MESIMFNQSIPPAGLFHTADGNQKSRLKHFRKHSVTKTGQGSHYDYCVVTHYTDGCHCELLLLTTSGIGTAWDYNTSIVVPGTANDYKDDRVTVFPFSVVQLILVMQTHCH